MMDLPKTAVESHLQAMPVLIIVYCFPSTGKGQHYRLIFLVALLHGVVFNSCFRFQTFLNPTIIHCTEAQFLGIYDSCVSETDSLLVKSSLPVHFSERRRRIS